MSDRGNGGGSDDTHAKNTQWVVEQVLSHGKGKGVHEGKTVFLVKWMGYPKSRNSWEPREHFAPSEPHPLDLYWFRLGKSVPSHGQDHSSLPARQPQVKLKPVHPNANRRNVAEVLDAKVSYFVRWSRASRLGGESWYGKTSWVWENDMNSCDRALHVFLDKQVAIEANVHAGTQATEKASGEKS